MSEDETPTWCIDFAYVEQGCLFVFGWFLEPGPRLQGLLLHLNGRHIDLARNVIRVPRTDVAAKASTARRRDNDYGLVAAVEVGAELAAGDPIELWVMMPGGAVQPIPAETSGNQARFVHFARANLLAVLQLLGGVPENQRVALSAIADRARAPADTQDISSADPLSVRMICAPTPDLLLVLGRIADPRRYPEPPELLLGEARAVRRLRLMPDLDGGMIFLMLAEVGGAIQHDRYVVTQRQPRTTQRVVFQREDIQRGLGALDALLVATDINLQLTVLEDLTDALAAHGDLPDAPKLRKLWTDRVERLPTRIEKPGTPTRLVLDQARQIGPHGVLLRGWTVHDAAQIRSIRFRAPDLPPCELPPIWVADQRHDVWKAMQAEGVRVDTDELGFTCFVPVGLADTTGCIIGIEHADGSTVRMRVEISRPPDDPLTLIRQILTSFPQTHRHLRGLMDRHVGPAVGAIWSSRPQPARTPWVQQFGPAPTAPTVSVVVPIYGRYDFIQFQLAQFANDPFLHQQQLIYVIDDPSLFDEARVAAIDLFGCYRVPFMLVYGYRNDGFAVATNLGAAQATGDYLLLLNSDVIPGEAGWLQRLVTAHAAHNAGAVAPRLLYEDGSLQHDGMRFYRLPVWSDLWVNDHPGKGQPASPPGPDRPCDTLTGACLLLRRETYVSLGGLSEDYIIGDFEDSDLCLKLLQANLVNWLIPTVQLYHLERQSQNMIGETDWRGNLSLYNCWLHNDRWGATIARRMDAA